MSEFKEPQFIHKYVSFDAGEAIISNNCFRFTNPKKFNDPFDCDINGVYFDVTGDLDERVKSDIQIMKKDFSEFVINNDALSKAYEAVVKSKRDNCAITCFSLDDNNFLMWSHYANNHSGMCLTFDNSLSNKDRILDTVIQLAGVVSYDFQGKFNYCTDKKIGMCRLFLTKAPIWKYEKEYRMLTFDDDGIYHYNPLYLSKITFGLRVELVEIERIMRVCKRVNLNHVRYYRATSNGADLTYEELTPMYTDSARWKEGLTKIKHPFVKLK